MLKISILTTFLIIITLNSVFGQVKYCFSCRSRGKLGDCRDPFVYNSTKLVPGVEAVPCASGWCSKTIEGDEYGEDHDLATERRCMQRIPPDNKARCSQALYQHKKIFICFCQGSYCNSGIRHTTSLWTPVLMIGLLKFTVFLVFRI